MIMMLMVMMMMMIMIILVIITMISVIILNNDNFNRFNENNIAFYYICSLSIIIFMIAETFSGFQNNVRETFEIKV